MKKQLIVLILLITSYCHGNFDLRGVKTENVRELWKNGGLILNSQKVHEISMFNVTPDIKGNKANFYFVVKNNGSDLFNLLTSDVRVTDQQGNRLNIVSKSDVVHKIKSQSDLRGFFTAVALGLSHASQPDAGEKYYNSHTYGSAQNRYTCTNYNSHTHGYLYDNNARYQQLRNNNLETQAVMSSLQVQEDIALDKADTFYLDNATIYPQETIGFNFQVEVPKHLMQTLQAVCFFYNVDGEEHSFVYEVENEQSSKYY